ncbi:hypothetical protein SERLA73DRAFT_73832 [Serpula lacrymans var. lacrymans S7.3]|uniref:Uncharacterized protein n=2 Tax=Serpula lacrymans var. lacrymans TaxID=341189 RepID=F8PWW8_SERL3|nr:uncharacterized protein SERLADRAFT_438464 [Serpula lacrymans var. lacrymans S7.9]EGN99295.1 hypothetical protein SERLA73DRAFT_73832 [Serpula lacrymans var. lacrymans S7.3]EGO24861.1 hypothetical protein SERLADRAFT_438464 [Serpula lacrymans var. lacrymans S7.9]
MSTSNPTGFPITIYSIPSDANLLADEQVSFARGQQHNQADVTDAIELMSAKDAYTYLFYETKKCCPHAYHAPSSMHTFLAIDLIADKLLKAIGSIHSLEKEHLQLNSQDSSICRALQMEKLVLESLEQRLRMSSSNGQTDTAREYLESGGRILLNKARTWIEQDGCMSTPPPSLSLWSLSYPDQISVTPERTYHIITRRPTPIPLGEKYIPTVPTSPILQESSHSSPRSIESNPKPLSPPSSPPRPVPNTQARRLTNWRGAQRGRQEAILRIPAARTPSKRQSRMSKGQKGSPPGAMHRPETGSPSNPINVDDDAAMINQLYTGTYDLGDDNPTTPQSDTSSNTRQKYHQGVCNNTPYCQNCGWSDHCTYYCEAYYCPNCDRRAPGHSFNWCPICREDKDRILMEGLHGDVSYDDSYNINGKGTKFW